MSIHRSKPPKKPVKKTKNAKIIPKKISVTNEAIFLNCIGLRVLFAQPDDFPVFFHFLFSLDKVPVCLILLYSCLKNGVKGDPFGNAIDSID